MNIHYIDMKGRSYREKFPRLRAALDEEEKPTLVFESVKGLRTLGPVWIGGIVGIGILILAAVFGLPALTGEPTPTPIVFQTGTSPASTPTFTSVPATQTSTSTPSPSPTATEEVPPTMTTIPTLASEINDAKGVEMVLVSAGIFKMGCNKGVVCEGPAHVVNMDSFYIDKFEVTNAQYLACEFDQQCNQPLNTRYYDNKSFRNHPVVFVSWNMAANYCAWRGARLPTEAEWEKAARADGIDMLHYPWGNRFNGDLLNSCDLNCSQPWKNRSYDDGFSDTAPVGIYEGGQSPYGVYDMAGNVIEWVNDWYDKDYYFISPTSNPQGPESGTQRVLRGGSWYSNQNYVRTFVRTSLSPTVAYNYVGFRCARSVGE
jgi:formylglycine-generating enzyme required for sulfatase activity